MRFTQRFSRHLSDAEILRFCAQLKFGGRTVCAWCRSYRVQRPVAGRWRCRRCWRYFDVATQSSIAALRAPLRFWYEIAWCFALQQSANKAHRFLKTAKYEPCLTAYQLIRKAILMESRTAQREQFHGTIELDESFYGGQFKNLRKRVRQELRRRGLNTRGRGAKFRKQPVFGIFKRNGRVYLEPIPEAAAEVLEPIIAKKVSVESSVFSDAGSWYNGLVGLGYVHRTIDHGREQYVNGDVHINGLEGFWGLSKTNMHAYKGIRKENWIYYLKEMEFRYNHREEDYDALAPAIFRLLLRTISL